MQQTHVIVGAGQAGAYAAIAMREAGFTGRIMLLGDETHLPYNRPPLSKSHIAAAQVPGLEHFYRAERYAEAGVDLMLGIAVDGIDPQAARIHLGDGTAQAYDRLLLATGSRARQLPIPGAEMAITLRTPEQALALRRRLTPGARVVCIGAGVIGLEIASSARQRGCSVIVLEAGPSAMGRSLSPQMAGLVQQLHRDAGVELFFNVAVERIEDHRIHCADGLMVEADVIVAGIGMERNTGLAQAGGLSVSGGILTDAEGRTSDAQIYAAGDVAAFMVPRLGTHRRLESWRHAQNHGIHVGRSMAGQQQSYDEVPWFWSDQHGANIQVAGGAEGGVATVLRGNPGDRSVAAFYLTATNQIAGVAGINAGREVAAGMRLINSARPVDPAVLADLAVPVQKLPTAALA